MDISNAQFNAAQFLTLNYQSSTSITAQTANLSGNGDSVSFGTVTVSVQESFEIVLERAQNRLQSVVADARAELGLPEGQEHDLSAEATGNRIFEFAFGFFDRFLDNHPELSGQEAKQAFVDLIQPAIEQGIAEAREILTAVNALDGETDALIDNIFDQVLARIDDFLGSTAA